MLSFVPVGKSWTSSSGQHRLVLPNRKRRATAQPKNWCDSRWRAAAGRRSCSDPLSPAGAGEVLRHGRLLLDPTEQGLPVSLWLCSAGTLLWYHPARQACAECADTRTDRMLARARAAEAAQATHPTLEPCGMRSDTWKARVLNDQERSCFHRADRTFCGSVGSRSSPVRYFQAVPSIACIRLSM